ncbi:MAG: hypothetical protein DME19_05570 [Verrucomicrobia bacterium]|nr:MAG: hypothetical protein DME19_05570 [Verrucomicrobiota bacterium]
MNDDRASVQPGDQVLLIVEDDPDFARILLDLAREKGFKALVTGRAEKALALASQHRPSAILLDLRLPDATGWSVFDRLKHDPGTRHIPVDIVSAEDNRLRGLRLGAINYLKKPVAREDIIKALDDTKEFINRRIRNLLVVAEDAAHRHGTVELIGDEDVQITAAASAQEAAAILENNTSLDCVAASGPALPAGRPL